MKKLILRSLALGLAFSGGLTAASADQACSEKTLLGSYIYSGSGPDKDNKPSASAGIDYFDGNGRIIWTATDSTGKSATGNGSYFVKGCKAEVKFSTGVNNTFFVAPSGDIFVWVVTNGSTIAGPARRVSEENIVGKK